MENKNIFENPPTIPVVVEIAGHKRVVGDATLTHVLGGIHVEMTLNTDDPAEGIDFLSGGLTSLNHYSIAEENATIHEDPQAQALFEFDAHDHKPVQHRDARRPWCNFCGLDVDLEAPKSSIDGSIPPAKPNANHGARSATHHPQVPSTGQDPYGFGRPSRLHGDITNG